MARPSNIRASQLLVELMRREARRRQNGSSEDLPQVIRSPDMIGTRTLKSSRPLSSSMSDADQGH